MSSALFPDSAVATLRQINEANLPHTCQLMAQTPGARQGGVLVEDFTASGQPFACRVRAAGSSEQLNADQLKNTSKFVVYVPVAITTITREHRLAVSGSLVNVLWAMTLKVEAPLGPKLVQTMRRYLCSVVDGDGA